MYYAIVDSRSDVTAATYLLWGETWNDVAKKLTRSCKQLMDEEYEDMSLDEIEEEYEEAVLDDYRALRRKRKVAADHVRGFYFEIGDMVVEVSAVCEDYESLKRAFAAYVSDKPELAGWKMAEQCEETDDVLSAMNDELLSLCDSAPFMESLSYFVREGM